MAGLCWSQSLSPGPDSPLGRLTLVSSLSSPPYLPFSSLLLLSHSYFPFSPPLLSFPFSSSLFLFPPSLLRMESRHHALSLESCILPLSDIPGPISMFPAWLPKSIQLVQLFGMPCWGVDTVSSSSPVKCILELLWKPKYPTATFWDPW